MPSFKIKGTVKLLTDVESRETRSGKTFCKRTLVLNVAGARNTTHDVAFVITDNNLKFFDEAQPGLDVEVSAFLSAREWQGRWFNDLEAYGMTVLREQGTAPATPPPAAAPAPAPAEDPNNDLPF